MSILFVAGPGRSGTTALSDYLNLHPEVALCRERYKFVVPQVTPDSFSFERILGSREGETNIPERYDARLLVHKEQQKLKWIGDKNPNYVRQMDVLLENNPGARFIVTYRSVEEVAESYDARARDLKDPWLNGRDGFKEGVKAWNRAMRQTRRFAEGGMDSRILIIGYHDFFYSNEACIPLITRFLGIEFDNSIRESWKQMSQSFEGKRRSKERVTEQQLSLLEQEKNQADEDWILGRIQRQWDELQAATFSITKEPGSGVRAAEMSQLQVYERLIGELKSEIEQERRKVRNLRRRVRSLKQQINDVRASKTWRRLQRLDRVRNTVRAKVALRKR